MSINELNAQARTYFDLLEQIEALQAEAEAIKDTFKEKMVDEGAEALEGAGWRATWHNTKSTRFDSKRFKAEHGDLYTAYSTSTTGTRFTLNAIKA